MIVQCENCGKQFNESKILFKLIEIQNLFERIAPGDIVPFGECPECDSFVYPYVQPIRVLWGSDQNGHTFESFNSEHEKKGYLQALDDHAGWLESEVFHPDKNGKFEPLEDGIREDLIQCGYSEDDLEW